MKRLLIIAALLVITASLALAQSPDKPTPDAAPQPEQKDGQPAPVCLAS